MTDTVFPKEKRVTGVVTVHPRGFGFLQVEEPPERAGVSAFLAPPDLRPFLTGDRVSAQLLPSGDGRWMAQAPSLQERSRATLFGQAQRRHGQWLLHVDREVAASDWPLHPGTEALSEGDWVVARIAGSECVAERVTPRSSDPSLERVIARYDLREGYPTAVLEEARHVAQLGHELRARRDLRRIPTMTIDGPSTRDIDDAISVLPASANGAMCLLVSIADVTAYVKEDSALDREARARATSVYLGGKVLPMFPEQLSTDALSLLPDQDRACLTVELRLDTEGNLLATDVYESLICSWARLTYDEVTAHLERGEVTEPLKPVLESMPWLRTAYARLSTARARRGGIEIEREDVRVRVNPVTGQPEALEAEANTISHRIIERFMVAANEAVARWLHERGMATLYRAHAEPTREAVADLEAFSANFGFHPGFGRAASPLALASFASQIEGSPSEAAIRNVLRRLLGWARYTVHPAAHFGLASHLYLHFTSPIRRYADVVVHRAIRRFLQGHRDQEPEPLSLETLAEHINERARVASKAEVERQRMLQAELLSHKIGQAFPGRVTRVRPFGLQIQLDSTGFEGILPLDTLPDGPFVPDERSTRVQGRTTSYTIGSALRVRVVSADPSLGRVELALA